MIDSLNNGIYLVAFRVLQTEVIMVNSRDIVLEMKSNNFQALDEYSWKQYVQSFLVYFRDVGLLKGFPGE